MNENSGPLYDTVSMGNQILTVIIFIDWQVLEPNNPYMTRITHWHSTIPKKNGILSYTAAKNLKTCKWRTFG